MLNEPVKVRLDKGPGRLRRRRLLGEEREHMDVDGVDGIEHVLRAAALLVPVRELADRDGDVQAREVLLGQHDLFRKLVVREHVVEERLRAKLQDPCHELGLGIRVQRGVESVAPPDPLVGAVESEPYESVHAEVVVPRRVHHVVAENVLVSKLYALQVRVEGAH